MHDMTYPRCETCKHWAGTYYKGHEPNRRCEVLTKGLFNVCFVAREDEMIPSGWDVDEIETGPRFGCVHHEERNEQ